MNRFNEPKEEDVTLVIGTYVLEDLIWQRPCLCDQIVTQDEVDEGYFSHVEFDLERAPDCEPELMRVRAYRAGLFVPISAGLQEVFSQYLQDDKKRWQDAKNWLDAMGERVQCSCEKCTYTRCVKDIAA